MSELSPSTIATFVVIFSRLALWDVMAEAEIKGLTYTFDLAIEHFLLHKDTGCSDEMEADGSGELTTQHSIEVKSTILDLFRPYERYLSTFLELISQLDGAFLETASLGLQHPRPFLPTRGFDTQVSTDTITSRCPLQS
jgi:hypothetical protein